MSLREHPVHFLRSQLAADGVVPCARLMNMKDGTRVHIAGLVLVRQRPGSAKGVVFITLEDESGIANAVLWPDRFEANRRTVMASTMLGVRGRVQREGQVIHVVVDRLDDLSSMLRTIGDVDLPRLTSRGDGATHGSAPDRGDPGWKPKMRSDYHYRDRRDEDVIPVKSHDFH